MRLRIYFIYIFIYILAASLTACMTSSLPPNFVYETSLRTEQGFIGASNRKASAKSLLSGGLVNDPTLSLQAALPDAQVKIRRWGVTYLPKNWARYQAVLDADVTQDGEKIKCRLNAPENFEDALSLSEIRAQEGAALQRLLSQLVETCAAQVKSEK